MSEMIGPGNSGGPAATGPAVGGRARAEGGRKYRAAVAVTLEGGPQAGETLRQEGVTGEDGSVLLDWTGVRASREGGPHAEGAEVRTGTSARITVMAGRGVGAGTLISVAVSEAAGSGSDGFDRFKASDGRSVALPHVGQRVWSLREAVPLGMRRTFLLRSAGDPDVVEGRVELTLTDA